MSFDQRPTQQETNWHGQDYPSATIDGKEAATVLGVSSGRWRQITGTRESPHPVIGPGQTETGRRGAQWPLSRVLQYAMDTRRDLPTPLPPLLPYPDGHPRYRLHSSRALRSASRPTPGAPAVTAWADLFTPDTRNLCGHPESPVLLLTPTWPTESWSVLTQLQPLVGAALHSRTWEDELSTISRLTIVLAPIGEDVPTAAWQHISSLLKTIYADQDWLKQARAMHAEARPSTTWGQTVDRLDLPARDVAAALGRAVPWWPAGCATSSTCARWAPNHPVTVTVPAPDADRLEAARWVQRSELPFDAWLADPDPQPPVETLEHKRALRLAAMALPSPPALAPSHADIYVPEGLEAAAVIDWPTPFESPTDVAPWPLLDSLLGDEHVPAHIAVALADYFGDPRYAPMARMSLADLPKVWTELFRQAATHHRVDPQATHRWRILRAADPEGVPVTLGPLRTPAIIGTETIVWLPPTGYRPETPGDDPAEALPASDDAHEVLLVREGTFDRVRGWARTLDGQVIPLPARSQFDMGLHGDTVVLMAALSGRAPSEIYDEESAAWRAAINDPPSGPLGPVDGTGILRLLRSVTDEPLTLTWSELTQLNP